MTKNAYAGAPTRPRKTKPVSDGIPLGPRGVALLRRVRSAYGNYRLCRNADREAVKHALAAGFLERHFLDSDVVALTGAGYAYLDRLMRAE